jgi:hypothetical protein
MPYPVDPYNHRVTGDVAAARLHEWYNDFMQKNAAPDITKVGPHGYIHGWIKVGPGGGSPNEGRSLFEDDIKPGHVINENGKHFAVTEKTSGYKFKNPAHTNGMRELKAVPVNADGTADPSAKSVNLYYDRYHKVPVAGHVPGTAAERADNRAAKSPKEVPWVRLKRLREPGNGGNFVQTHGDYKDATGNDKYANATHVVVTSFGSHLGALTRDDQGSIHAHPYATGKPQKVVGSPQEGMDYIVASNNNAPEYNI